MNNRKWVPLQPASRSDSTGPETVSSPPTKRRRIGVTVACDSCRRKKRRCDGQRPICEPCLQRNETCFYQERRSHSHNNHDGVVEVIRLLNAMQPEKALQSLGALRYASNAGFIIESLKGAMHGRVRPSDLKMAKALTAKTSIALELLAKHPITFINIQPYHFSLEESEDVDGQPPRSGKIQHQRTQRTIPHVPPSLKHSRSVNSESSVSSSPERNPSAASSTTSRPTPKEVETPIFCDERLANLDIKYWTNVDISDVLAARMLSLYLRTDHPLLGFFAPEGFVSDLVNRREKNCSRMLVNALFFWACQMYCTIDNEASGYVGKFSREAISLWGKEQHNDNIHNMAAAVLLSLGCVGQGDDHVVSEYSSQASSMGMRLGLFGSSSKDAQEKMKNMDDEEILSFSYASWGVFNYTTLLAVFYRQPGVKFPRMPPVFPIPGLKENGSVDLEQDDAEFSSITDMPRFMGQTFPYLCKLWLIMHDVAMVYYCDTSPKLKERAQLQFAEYKFRELLVLGDSLPTSFGRGHRNAHHTVIFHIWFHAAVLDIFRPCIFEHSSRPIALKTFASLDGTPAAVYAASLDQLKRLILLYRMKYRSSSYTMLWHTALLYVANAVLQDTSSEDWLFYFLVCLYGYEQLRPSYPVSRAIAEGLLTMCVRDNKMSIGMARRLREELHRQNFQSQRGLDAMNTIFALDLELTMSDPTSASVDTLSKGFEDHALIQEFTNVFDTPNSD